MIFAWWTDTPYERRRWPADLLFLAILIYVGRAFLHLPDGPDPSEWRPTYTELAVPFLPAIFFIYLMNMLFVFGRAVLAKTGGMLYLILLIAFGGLAYAAGALHNRDLFWTTACTVNAILGMYLMYWPTQTVDVMLITKWEIFEFAGYWVIAVWAVMDFSFTFIFAWADGLIAHPAFLLLGLAAAHVLIKCRLVPIDKHDYTLIQALTEKHPPEPPLDHPYPPLHQQDPKDPRL